MITLVTTSGTTKFNLKDYAREIAFCQTVTKLQSEHSAATLNITTSYGEKLSIKTPDIVDLKFQETEFVKTVLHEEQPIDEQDMVDRVLKGINSHKRKKVEHFLNILKKQGTPINPDDPRLQDIIDHL